MHILQQQRDLRRDLDVDVREPNLPATATSHLGQQVVAGRPERGQAASGGSVRSFEYRPSAKTGGDDTKTAAMEMHRGNRSHVTTASNYSRHGDSRKVSAAVSPSNDVKVGKYLMQDIVN